MNGGGGIMRIGPYYTSGADRDYLEMIADGYYSRIITNNECMGIQNCGGPLLLQPNSGSGNVGIGTTSPTTGKLEVAGSILTSGGLVAALANSAALSFESTFSRLIAFGTDASTNGCFRLISSRSDGSNQLTWLAGNASGNVGINCLTPSYKLHVNGTFYAAGSSQDYKQSICNYNTDSCMFMKLKPVTYQYKEEYCHLGKELKSGTQIGLIAEEVAESHPELAILVNEEDNKVVRNVDYEKLTIILLSELQKLRQEVDQLKNK